ncbi:MAG: hypothetical protein WAK76_04275, partial [Trebonia sp.]
MVRTWRDGRGLGRRSLASRAGMLPKSLSIGQLRNRQVRITMNHEWLEFVGQGEQGNREVVASD